MRIAQVQAGLAKFIVRDVVPSLSGWDRVLVGGGGGLLASRLPALLQQYAAHPLVAALGVYDAEAEEIDLDTLQQAVQPYIGADALPIKIPLVGITIKLSQREIDNLFAYIREG